MMDTKKQGFTMVELMAALAIVIMAASISWVSMGNFNRQADIQNQARYLRNMITHARSVAIEYAQPVRLTLFDDTTLLIERDANRDGDWTDSILVKGVRNADSTLSGMANPYEKITKTTAAEVGRSLPHWTGLASLGDVAEFTEDDIIILPDGTILAGSPLAKTSGTFYFTDDRDFMKTAVHVTAMGEIRLAKIYQDVIDGATGPAGSVNGWNWFD